MHGAKQAGRCQLQALPCTFTPGWRAWLFTDSCGVTFSKYVSQQRRGGRKDSRQKNGCLKGASSQQHLGWNRKYLAVCFKIKRHKLAAGRDKVNFTCLCRGDREREEGLITRRKVGPWMHTKCACYLGCMIHARRNLSDISAVCTEAGNSAGLKRTRFSRWVAG